MNNVCMCVSALLMPFLCSLFEFAF
jgi:hypothetical protein